MGKITRRNKRANRTTPKERRIRTCKKLFPNLTKSKIQAALMLCRSQVDRAITLLQYIKRMDEVCWNGLQENCRCKFMASNNNLRSNLLNGSILNHQSFTTFSVSDFDNFETMMSIKRERIGVIIRRNNQNIYEVSLL